MKAMKLFSLSTVVLALLLAGCGGDTKKVEEPKKVEAPPAKPGLGLSQAELLKGIDEIKLEPTSGAFLGHTSDRAQGGTTFASIVAKGTPEVVTYAMILAGYDTSKSDTTARNLKYIDTFLSNVFGGQVPDEVKKELEFVKTNLDKKREVVVGNRTVTLFQELTKQIQIEVR